MPKGWTQEQLDYLRKHYPTTTNKELGERFGKDHTTIGHYARRLGLVKDMEAINRLRSEKTKARSRWTPEVEAKLVELYALMPNPELSKILGIPAKLIYEKANKMGLSKPKELLAKMQYERMERMPEVYEKHRFKKGNVPFHAGTKGVYKFNSPTQFKKGNRPPMQRKVGTQVWRNGGNSRYLWEKVADPNVWRPVHHIVWEKAHGPLQEGSVVIFKDLNRSNFALENLECISKSELSTRNIFWNKYPEEIAQAISLRGQLEKALRKAKKRKEDHEHDQ